MPHVGDIAVSYNAVLGVCSGAPKTLLHNWFAVGHNHDWTRLRLFCSRCRQEQLASVADYQAWQVERETIWSQQPSKLTDS